MSQQDEWYQFHATTRGYIGTTLCQIPTLKGSVGQDAENNPLDVLLVQRLLNQAIDKGYIPQHGAHVPETGRTDGWDNTIMLIRQFQINQGLLKQGHHRIITDDENFKRLLKVVNSNPIFGIGVATHTIQNRLRPIIREIPILDPSTSFNPSAYNIMRRIIEVFVNDSASVAAFRAIGTDLVYRLTATGQGIQLGPNNFFKGFQQFQRATVKKLLGITDMGLDRALAMTKAGGGNAFTLGRKADLDVGGLPAIFISGNAVYVGEEHLAYTLAHELIHAFGWEGRGGTDPKKGKFYPRGATPHDLDHMGKKHDDILEACVKGKFKNN